MYIGNIKKYLMGKIGNDIIVIYHGSRNRREKYVGKLYKTYNSVFSIRLLNGNIKTFSYSDILIKTIKISI